MYNYNISDAFKALKTITDENLTLDELDGSFKTITEAKSINLNNKKDIEEGKKILNKQTKEDDTEQIVDVNAATLDDLKKSYVGDTILQCPVCRTLVYKHPDELIKSEEKDNNDNELYNIEEECPHCHSTGGFILKGQVAKYDANYKPEDKANEEEQEITPNIDQNNDDESRSLEQEIDELPTLDDIESGKVESEETEEDTTLPESLHEEVQDDRLNKIKEIITNIDYIVEDIQTLDNGDIKLDIGFLDDLDLPKETKEDINIIADYIKTDIKNELLKEYDNLSYYDIDIIWDNSKENSFEVDNDGENCVLRNIVVHFVENLDKKTDIELPENKEQSLHEDLNQNIILLNDSSDIVNATDNYNKEQGEIYFNKEQEREAEVAAALLGKQYYRVDMKEDENSLIKINYSEPRKENTHENYINYIDRNISDTSLEEALNNFSMNEENDKDESKTKILNEVFSSSMPDWLKKYLDNNTKNTELIYPSNNAYIYNVTGRNAQVSKNLNKSFYKKYLNRTFYPDAKLPIYIHQIPSDGSQRQYANHPNNIYKTIALDKANFISGDIPLNARDPRLKEPNIPFIETQITDTFGHDIKQLYIKSYTDNFTYILAGSSKYSSMNKTYKYTSLKKILENAINFCYLDGSDSNNFADALKAERGKRNVDYVETPGVRINKGQFLNQETGKWENILKQTDKSGYLITDISQILKKIHKQNYSRYFDSIYNKLEAIKVKINNYMQSIVLKNVSDSDIKVLNTLLDNFSCVVRNFNIATKRLNFKLDNISKSTNDTRKIDAYLDKIFDDNLYRQGIADIEEKIENLYTDLDKIETSSLD